MPEKIAVAKEWHKLNSFVPREFYMRMGGFRWGQLRKIFSHKLYSFSGGPLPAYRAPPLNFSPNTRDSDEWASTSDPDSWCLSLFRWIYRVEIWMFDCKSCIFLKGGVRGYKKQSIHFRGFGGIGSDWLIRGNQTVIKVHSYVMNVVLNLCNKPYC